MSLPIALLQFARREWLTRRAWLAALALLLAVPVLYKGEVQTAYATFFLAVVLPLLAFGLAATPDPAGGRYWATLGGSPRARATVRLAGHSGLLGLVFLLLLPYMDWYTADGPGAIGLAGLGTLVGLVYTSAALARRTLSAAGALAGPLVVAGLLALGGWGDHQLGSWSIAEWGTIRGVALLVAMVLALVRGEGRLAGRQEERWLVARGVGIAGAMSLVHAAWSLHPLTLSPPLEAVSVDGSEALYLPQPAGPLAPRRALLWREGVGFAPIGPRGAELGDLLPNGRLIVMEPGEGGSLWLGDERTSSRCDLPAENILLDSWTVAEDAVLVVLNGPPGGLVMDASGRCEYQSGSEGTIGRFRWKYTGHETELEPEPPERGWRQGRAVNGRLTDQRSGASWPLPEDLRESGAVIWPHDDGVRAFFDEGPILELGPEGERERHVFTVWEALWG